MSAMDISLPESPKSFVRRNQDRQQLRDLLLDGARSAQAAPADAAWFAALRAKVHQHRDIPALMQDNAE